VGVDQKPIAAGDEWYLFVASEKEPRNGRRLTLTTTHQHFLRRASTCPWPAHDDHHKSLYERLTNGQVCTLIGWDEPRPCGDFEYWCDFLDLPLPSLMPRSADTARLESRVPSHTINCTCRSTTVWWVIGRASQSHRTCMRRLIAGLLPVIANWLACAVNAPLSL
jgi:hypothetical protein